MNKLISIVCTLALLVGFFCAPGIVHAEDSRVRYIRTYTGNISAASLTYSATAMQFNYNTETALEGGVESPILITCRFTNNGSNDVKISNSYVELSFSTSVLIQNVDIYTTDLMVQLAGTSGQTTPRYNIIASNDFNYNGHIVIPHNSTLYLIFEVDIRGYVDTANSTVTGPYLDAVFVSIQTSDVQTGEFTTGTIPRELDQIELLISALARNDNLSNFATDVHTLLSDIKNQIRFTGTYVPPTASVYNSQQYTDDVNDLSYVNSFSVRRVVYPSYLLNNDFELNGNSYVQYGYKRIVFDYYIEFTVPNPITYNHFMVNVPLTTTSSVVPYVAEMQSNFATSVFTRDSVFYVVSNGSTTNRYLIPSGRNYVNLVCYIDVPEDTVISYIDFNNFSDDIFHIYNVANYNGYYPHSIESGIADLFNNLTGNTTQNDSIGTESDAAGTLSDQIHQQEETWYDENSAAMEAVGLSSYRFTNQQASGILGVTTQFEQLWLALGNWTLVYIFVLMASLATFILRHEPSTRVKQMREMYMTDRAVARDWEMRTNPEKFSHRRWVENNRRH